MNAVPTASDPQAVARAGRTAFTTGARLVIKLGSALVCPPDAASPDTQRLAAIAQGVAAHHARGAKVVIVSSGAVAAGRRVLALNAPPRTLQDKQACAAAGQPALIAAWSAAFARHDLHVAQALLTLDDTERRRRWLNARATLARLLEWGVVPIINENDSVATDELRYGDNDRLAARVAQIISADALVLLSDVDGLYTADPRRDPTASRLEGVGVITPEIDAMAGGPGADIASGGMRSKLEAARIATAAGCAVAIAPGSAPDPLGDLADDGPATWFAAAASPQNARKAWIAGALKPAGAVHVDAGAAAALATGRSLLPVGVTQADGAFEKGDAVCVLDPHGREVARGLIAYDASEARKIMGARSENLSERLGYEGPRAIIHRDDLVMTDTAPARGRPDP